MPLGRWWVERLVNLLLSASSPGAADLLASILPILTADTRFNRIEVLVQGPAVEKLAPICAQLNLTIRSVINERGKLNELTGGILDQQVNEFVVHFQPHAVLTGLSGPDLGLDEWLIHYAKEQGALTYSLQDAPGWVVKGISGPASSYFVQSLDLVESTLVETEVENAINVGSLKLMRLKQIADKLADRPFPPEKSIIFFGQPLWHLQGYGKTVHKIAQYAQDWGCGALYYRPHPLENTCEYSELSKMNVKPDPSGSYEEALASYAAIASCFSTALSDAPILAKLMHKPQPNIVYCLMKDDIRNSFVKNSQPLEDTRKSTEYATFLTECISSKTAFKEVFQTPVAQFTLQHPMPEYVAQTIWEDITSREFLPQNYAANEQLDADVTHGGTSRETLPIQSVLQSLLGPIGKLEPSLEDIALSPGPQSYLRGKLTGQGEIFIKTLDPNQSARIFESASLETQLAQTCPHVVAPLTKQPLYCAELGQDVYVAPFVRTVQLDLTNSQNIDKLGAALASMHKSMSVLKPVMSRAVARTEWLKSQWQYLPKALEDGRLFGNILEHPWLTAVLEDIGQLTWERFNTAQHQLIHGDLNSGNILQRKGDGQILFIDFEEAVQTRLPVFFDLAIFIERMLLVPNAEGWQKKATTLLESYFRASSGSQLPYEDCLSEALKFAALRSICILIMAKRTGQPWPNSEWNKFEKLTRLTHEKSGELAAISRGFL